MQPPIHTKSREAAPQHFIITHIALVLMEVLLRRRIVVSIMEETFVTSYILETRISFPIENFFTFVVVRNGCGTLHFASLCLYSAICLQMRLCLYFVYFVAISLGGNRSIYMQRR